MTSGGITGADAPTEQDRKEDVNRLYSHCQWGAVPGSTSKVEEPSCCPKADHETETSGLLL